MSSVLVALAGVIERLRRSNEQKLNSIDTHMQDIISRLDAGVNATIVGDNAGLAKEATLQSILSQLQTGVSTTIVGDNVGLAREGTLQSVLSQLQKFTFDENGNLLAAINADNVGLAKELTLQDIKSILSNLSFDASKNLLVGLNADDVGLAKEATLQGIKAQTDRLTFDTSGNLKVNIGANDAGLATEATLASIAGKLDVQLGTRASENTLAKQMGFMYDYAVRKSGGRLLSTIDFTLKKPDYPVDEFDLLYVKVEGDYESYSIVSYADEGIPMPEGAGSPYVLKIVVPAGGTCYVRVPVKARYFIPFCAYITLYANADVYVLPFISLGGYYTTATRNKLPRNLRLPANRWGRFIVHWFMEAHHGCSEVDILIYNPQTTSVNVYIGMISACELYPHSKGFMLIFGWEGEFELEVSDETLEFWVDFMVPTDIKPVIHMSVDIGIVGDGTNALTCEVYIHPSGIQLISTSNASTSPAYTGRQFKVYLNRLRVYGHPTFSIQTRLSTSGTGKLVKFIVVLYAFTDEYTYQKYVETTVGGGSTVTILDLGTDVKHICGGCLEVTAPSDGDVNIIADTPEGEITICKIPANTTKTVEIKGRYTYIKAANKGTSDATVRGSIVISESLLLR